MDFTSLYTSTNTLLSPDSHSLLSATPGFLVLRDATSFQVLQSWRSGNGKASLTQLAFSRDSRYCLAADIPGGSVLVYEVDSEKPVASIKAGPEGLQGVRWLEGGGGGARLVACWARHGLRITVWNLETGRQHHIQSPKRGASAGWAVHPVSQDYLALLERHKGKDYLGIYDLASMTLVRHTVLPTTDVQDLSWSPCGRYIAVWESCLEYALHILTPDGRLLHSHLLPSDAQISGLGIRCVTWHPSGRFLAIGGYDDTLRIINDVGWSIGVEVELPGSAWTSSANKKGKGKVPTHREPQNWLADPATSGSIVSFDSLLLPISQLATSSSPSNIPSSSTIKGSITHPTGSSAKELGISQLSFSPSGKFIFLHSTTPLHGLSSQILILRFVRSSPALPYTATRPRVCCVIRTNQIVRKVEWKPTKPEGGEEKGGGECLAIVTGEKSVLLWNEKVQNGDAGDGEEESSEEDEDFEERQRVLSPGVVEGVAVPSKTEFGATDVSWSRDGGCMLLQGDKSFCLAYPLPGSA